MMSLRVFLLHSKGTCRGIESMHVTYKFECSTFSAMLAVEWSSLRLQR